jgi:hypothetical protein
MRVSLWNTLFNGYRPRRHTFGDGVDKEMAPRSVEIAYELRCCIVCLHCFLPPPQNQLARIAKLLNLKPRAAQSFYQRTRRRAQSDDLKELLACVGNLNRSGRPVRIQDGTKASAALRSLLTQLDEHQLRHVAKAGEQITGQRLTRGQVEKVAHRHRGPMHDYDIVRRVRPLIPGLSFLHIDSRDIFCQWVLIKIEEGAIFIFIDESSIEVGASHKSVQGGTGGTRGAGHLVLYC